MPRISKPDRISLWLARLNRFAESGQSVVEFCRSESISQPSFYQWKRRLSPSVGRPNSPRIKKPSASGTSFTELAVVSPQSTATRIRLAHNVVIELGSEQTTVATVIAQVLDRCLLADSSKTPSC